MAKETTLTALPIFPSILYHCEIPVPKDLINFSLNLAKKDEGLNHSDIIFIMVQTPNSGGNKFYDHSIVSNLLQKINEKKVENKHYVYINFCTNSVKLFRICYIC